MQYSRKRAEDNAKTIVVILILCIVPVPIIRPRTTAQETRKIITICAIVQIYTWNLLH